MNLIRIKSFCFHLFLIFPFLIIGSGISSFAQKNDTITLKNGSHLTGEIKRLKNGVLFFSTDDMGSLAIDWTKILNLKSNKTFEILMSNGMIYFATLDTSGEPGKITLITQLYPSILTLKIDKEKIVRMVQLESKFWSSFDGKFSVGYGINKADNQTKFNLMGDINFRSRKYMSSLSVVSNLAGTSHRDLSKNQEMKYSFYRLISGRWYGGTRLSADQNTEMGVNARIIAAGEVARRIFETNLHMLTIIGGAQITREWRVDSTLTNNLEGSLESDYAIYKFQHPEISVGLSFSIYPNLTEFGGLRTDASVNASIEIFKDFIFQLSGYHKFDNRSTIYSNSSSDWGFNTGIGYSF